LHHLVRGYANPTPPKSPPTFSTPTPVIAIRELDQAPAGRQKRLADLDPMSMNVSAICAVADYVRLIQQQSSSFESIAASIRAST
jgi:hypothetical protein